MLLSESQAVLYETRAADAWAEYEADSLKAHLADTAAMTTNGSVNAKLAAESRKYRARQNPLRASATAGEHQRDEASDAADRAEGRKLFFDAAVALFEIAIVLASVAAMVRRTWLVIVAAGIGVAAIVTALRGLTV